jgi:thymidine kinase
MHDSTNGVTVFTGPMFSGKFGSLITRANSAIRADKTVLAVKPETDTRDKAEIVTRLHDPLNGTNIKRSFENAHVISDSDPDDLHKLFETHDPDAFIADEIQFFDEWFVNFMQRVQIHGLAEVYLAGLDLDAWGNSFGYTGDLLALADTVEKMTADCFVQECQKKATRTQLIDSERVNGSPIEVGGKETYEARCSSCWVHPDHLTQDD